jgi:NTP pyrophosphatase (non-canonical NTP hydrolase)
MDSPCDEVEVFDEYVKNMWLAKTKKPSPTGTPKEEIPQVAVAPLSFGQVFRETAQEVHATARSKGWWDSRDGMERLSASESSALLEFTKATLDAACIALIHSELSEAIEAARAGDPPDDKIPEYSGVEAELADVIIRIMDIAAHRGWRVGDAVEAKMAMNRGRSRMHGGKKF